MATVFNEEDSVFFVGGRGTKAGDANAGGGCTKVFWDASLDLADVMGANGEPVTTNFTWNGNKNACACDESGGGWLRITKVGRFNNVETGHIAHVKFIDTFDDGRYKVRSASDDIIELEYTCGPGDTTCDVKVGGAFDELQTALDETDADDTVPHNVTVYNNKVEILAAMIDFPSGGSGTDDTHLIVEGFNTQPGDMNYGGDYYQGPLDAYINGIDTDKCVDIDADGNAIDIMEIDGKKNISLRNLYLHNSSGDNNDGIAFISLPQNIQLVNCRFDSVYKFFAGVTYGIEMTDGFFKSSRYTYGASITWYASLFHRCVFDNTGRSAALHISCSVFKGCLFFNGVYALSFASSNGLVNCVCYNQSSSCIRLAGAAAGIWGHNNVFVPAEVSDFVVLMTAVGGSISPEFTHNCLYSIGNGVLTNQVYNQKTGEYYDLPGVVIEEDPQFIDVVNGDFRLQMNSPCLKTGLPTFGKL